MTRTSRLRVAAVTAVVSAGCVWTAAAWAAADTIPLPPDLVAPKSGVITLTGTLTAGPECTAIRADDGAFFSLVVPDRRGLHIGDHVRIRGHLAAASVCMNGTTVVVDRIEATAGQDIIVK